MPKLLPCLALIAAALAAPRSAPAQADIVTDLFAETARLMAAEGYAPTGWDRRGMLKRGESVVFPLTLEGGGDRQLVGVCDGQCGNLDLHLTDEAGKDVAIDREDDDTPIVAAGRAGRYTLRVTMTACSSSACGFGVKAFAR